MQPEILDTLPGDSPDAHASRRDLRFINRMLGTRAWFSKVLRRQHRTGERALEIGAGDGSLGSALASVLPDLTGLDLAARPEGWPQAAGWIQTDVVDFSGWDCFPAVIGNLFFHHFHNEQLGRIGAQLDRHARLIVASEPLRARRAVRLFSLLCPLIQAHPVTRHDGRVSIAAGFRNDELPRLLGLDPKAWNWRVCETLRGASRMVAEKRA